MTRFFAARGICLQLGARYFNKVCALSTVLSGVVSEPQIRFLHKRFLQLDRGCDGFIGTKDLLTDEKFTHFNPWFITFVEVSGGVLYVVVPLATDDVLQPKVAQRFYLTIVRRICFAALPKTHQI